MSFLKVTALALMIPAALTAPAFAQDAGRDDRPQMVFTELDTDGNGSITLEELEGAGAARFAAADTNGDGALSRDELIAQAQTRTEARVDRMLERLDADADGQITLAEAEAVHEGRGNGRGPSPERMFERFDADSDGAVTQAEFDEALADMMDRRGERHGDRQGGRHGDRG